MKTNPSLDLDRYLNLLMERSDELYRSCGDWNKVIEAMVEVYGYGELTVKTWIYAKLKYTRRISEKTPEQASRDRDARHILEMRQRRLNSERTGGSFLSSDSSLRKDVK
jgi:hypothetical protein